MITIELSGQPRLKATTPPVYNESDDSIEITDEPATPQPTLTPPPTSEIVATTPTTTVTVSTATATVPTDTIAAPAPTNATGASSLPRRRPDTLH